MSTDGWQTRVGAWLQHNATLTAHALSWIPGRAVALILVVGVAAIVMGALTRHPSGARDPQENPHADPRRYEPDRGVSKLPPAVGTSHARETR